ncbi:DUF3997 domain-containing protein [Pedobacter sp. 22163]|uniref:DUF3997 domain-containing protein n=1 Tax=Pedobacter sp. 22163 TaxID=3453883 RepID=UPI003F8391C1
MKYRLRKILFLLFGAAVGTILGCAEYQPTSLGNGYVVDFNIKGAKLSILNSKNTILVESQVLGYGFDSRYIVASQRPWDSIPECKFLNGESPDQCKLAFEKSNFCQYWIIEKKNEKVFGPYSLEQYNEQHRQLGINAEIELKTR